MELIIIAKAMFTNHSIKYVYEKKVERGSRERKYYQK